MPITLTAELTAGLPPRPIRELATRVCSWLDDRVADDHELIVILVNSHTMLLSDGTPEAYGTFTYHERSGLASIHVSCLYHGEASLDAWLEILMHEFSHYEQWRDDKPVQERGVAVRARNLAAQFLDEDG